MEAIFNSATGGNIRPNYLKKLKVSSTDDPHDVEEKFFVDYGDTLTVLMDVVGYNTR